MELPIAHAIRTASDKAICLTADQKAVLTKQLGTTYLMLKTLHDHLVGETLTEGFTVTSLSLLEIQLRDLANATGVPCESAAEAEERYANLRKANQRIHELEASIGTQAAYADVALGVKKVSDSFKAWWKQRGFGLVSSVHVDGYGQLRAELSGYLFPPEGPAFMSSTPVTDKELAAKWYEGLEARGFKLASKRYGSSGVVDCPENRAALAALITEIPSLTILEIVSTHSEGVHYISRLNVVVQDLRQVLAVTPEGLGV